jgi:hypothetical protein
MNALQKFSIFEETDGEGLLPVKPVRTERRFGEAERRRLSADNISNRINQLVRHEYVAGASESSVALSSASTYGSAEPIAATSTKIKRLLNVPKAVAPLFFTSTFSPVQEWEGYVRAFGPDSMSADLVDVTAYGKRITQQAEIPLEELSDNDREKLRIGAIFRWSIGYQRTPRGTKMRVSNIVFRDLPRWTQKELREASEEAAELEQYFKPGRPELPSAADSTKSR